MNIDDYVGKEPRHRFELMYRQPGLPEHQNITDVLDEIILTLRDIEKRLLLLEQNNGTNL
jgi:hypothetical protein